MKRSTPMKRTSWPRVKNRDPGGKPFVLGKISTGTRSAQRKEQAKRMRNGKSTTTPTKEEARWMAAIAEFGCIVCWLEYRARTPAAVHHILSGGRRIGHLETIPLCDPGHHQNAAPGSGMISRHPDKARFESRYGAEQYLLEQTRLVLGWKTEAAA